MGQQPRRVVRIAHAYGNNRSALKKALASDVDMIEVDMWYRAGHIEVRHEHRLPWGPILIDGRMATHKPGRFAVPFGKYYVRPDIGTMRLEDLFDAVAGRKRLLLDVKGHYKPDELERYVDCIVALVRDRQAESWSEICGQTYSVLHRIREVAPDLEVRYSIEQPYQWERFERLLAAGHRQICMAHAFLTDERAAVLEREGVNVYCWTVDDPQIARRLVGEGVDGIISNNLSLLASL